MSRAGRAGATSGNRVCEGRIRASGGGRSADEGDPNTRRATVAENSAISWTTHTFNPWIGCTKVSEGCKNCYAEADFDARKGFAKWGPGGTRVVTSDANWHKPVRWNAGAEWWCDRCQAHCFERLDRCRGCGGVCRKPGPAERPRVFCASLADVFEGPETMPAEAAPAVVAARHRLLGLIARTPNLDWLLLTKRPQNVVRLWDEAATLREGLLDSGPPLAMPMPNVWLGTSVENQAAADARIPHLLRTPAAVRFLSMEPLLGPVSLFNEPEAIAPDELRRRREIPVCRGARIDWVIVGGESGHGARPMQIEWARSLVAQCKSAGVACFVKQMGENAEDSNSAGRFSLKLKDKKGGDISEFPADLQVREFPR